MYASGAFLIQKCAIRAHCSRPVRLGRPEGQRLLLGLVAGMPVPDLDRSTRGTGPLPLLPAPRDGDPAGDDEDLVEAATGEFDVLPDDPTDDH